MIYKSKMFDFLKRELEFLNREGLVRKPRVISDFDGARVQIGQRWLISFCSNDYLGLAQHPAMKKAVVEAIRRFGAGAGAARLLSGTTVLHAQLEKEIARFKRADDALLFTSGYAANLGVITTLIQKGDRVFCDELNHASLVDSARLATRPSGQESRLHVYRHRDTAHLETLLRNAVRSAPRARRYIVTDAIFSMDGDGARLREIVRLAGAYRAHVLVDEAHGTGVAGKKGRGWCEAQGVEKQIDVIIGTASKALGSLGGFVAGPKTLIDYIRNKSRPFIFTTALPAGVCAATITALKILRTSPFLRQRLWANTDYLKDRLLKMGFALRGSVSPIIPILIGDTKKTVTVSRALWKKGLYIPAIRPPTVPKGESRLRVTVTAMHTREQMDLLLRCLKTLI